VVDLVTSFDWADKRPMMRPFPLKGHKSSEPAIVKRVSVSLSGSSVAKPTRNGAAVQKRYGWR
jgi:hypothetical protein